MKAFKIMIVFFGILLVGGLASGQPAHEGSDFKPDSEPDGFRGIKWGTNISTLKDMTLVMTIDKDTKRYKRNGDVLKMGDVNLSYIHYEFWKGSFYLVDIGCEGVENWNHLRSRMFATFGKGRSDSKKGDQVPTLYRWDGEETTILMISDPKMGGGLTISSTEITDRKAKEEEE